MPKLTNSRILELTRNTINFPMLQTDSSKKNIHSITYIEYIGKADSVGGPGIPETITLVKENVNGNKVFAEYMLVESERVTDEQESNNSELN